jgi:hypothetical protein
MKKLIFIPIFLFFISCTTFNNIENMSNSTDPALTNGAMLGVDFLNAENFKAGSKFKTNETYYIPFYSHSW